MRRPRLLDISNGETVFAAKQRADMLRSALLTLTDDELTVVTLRFSGATIREAAIHIGFCHVTALRYERKAIKKLRKWFEDKGVSGTNDIF